MTDTDYSSVDLQCLSDREHVRRRPRMYLGSVASEGLHFMVEVAVETSINETPPGSVSNLHITVHSNGSCTVEDDGCGISVKTHSEFSEKMQRDVSILEGVMTSLRFNRSFGEGAYQYPGWRHSIGLPVVNFLSERCKVQSRRDGYLFQQEYAQGEPASGVQQIGKSDRTGANITFKPDPEIFETLKFNAQLLQDRFQELAMEHPQVSIHFLDERTGRAASFQKITQ